MHSQIINGAIKLFKAQKSYKNNTSSIILVSYGLVIGCENGNEFSVLSALASVNELKFLSESMLKV